MNLWKINVENKIEKDGIFKTTNYEAYITKEKAIKIITEVKNELSQIKTK